jgi:hypothetical protein
MPSERVSLSHGTSSRTSVLSDPSFRVGLSHLLKKVAVGTAALPRPSTILALSSSETLFSGSSGKSGKALQVHAIRLKALLVAPFSESSAAHAGRMPNICTGSYCRPLKRLPPSAVKANPPARYAVLDFRRGSEQASQCRQRPNRHDDSIFAGVPGFTGRTFFQGLARGCYPFSCFSLKSTAAYSGGWWRDHSSRKGQGSPDAGARRAPPLHRRQSSLSIS